MQKKETNFFNRRTFLSLASGAFLASLNGCGSPVENKTPPIIYEVDPADCETDINWIPDVAHPVTWGVQTFEQDYGAPRDMLIYYPSCHVKTRSRRDTELDLSGIAGGNPAPIHPAPILRLSAHKYPLVLLLHGNMPYRESGAFSASHQASHRMWGRLAATLAASGYVVAVPRYDASLIADGVARSENIQLALDIIQWVRTSWRESAWVNQLPRMTAVIGHSNGALLGASLCAAHPELGAFVSLGAQYLGTTKVAQILSSISIPSLYMWATGSPSENVDLFWSNLKQPKYRAEYAGTHFDYLEPADTGTLPRGNCSHMPGFAADLVTLFISKFLQGSAQTTVPVDLSKPQVSLTIDQAFYANGHLQNINEIQAHTGCLIDLQWNLVNATGSKRFGPP
jgi:pimeloyl-ACP methyl ester carboxylesterase